MDYATNFEKRFWEMIYHGTSPMIYHFSKSFLKIWLFMFCLHSLAMVGWPIHSRTADTATVLSISQPAPIHREYEKNISRKFIYILLILKCNFLFILIPYVVKTWVFQFFLFHKKYIYQLQKSFASVIFKWTSSHSLLTYRPSCHFEFSGWPNFCHHHLNLDLGSHLRSHKNENGKVWEPT